MAIWTVSNYYKKSVEEHERFSKDGKWLIRKTGWRFGSWTVTTTDDNTPDFDWQSDDDPQYACINMNDCTGSNIEEVEFLETWDGCWDDYEFDDSITEEEREAIMNVIEEEGFWELENQGWYPEDCECYVWGPIQIDNEANELVRVVCSDPEGNTVDFQDVEKKEQWQKAEITDELQDVFQEGLGNKPANSPGPAATWPFPEPKDEL